MARREKTMPRKAEKVKKTKKVASGGVRSFIIRILFVVFVCYVAVSFIQIQVSINEKKQQLTVLQKKIAEQEQTNAELQEMLDNGIDDDYIAKIARKHGYAMPDERVYESTAEA